MCLRDEAPAISLILNQDHLWRK